jgi:putative Mn2+ efflux pump MntP
MKNQMKQYFQLLTQKQLLGFYSSTLLRAVSKSLVRVFIAIHLLKLGYSLRSVIIEFLALKSVVWPIGSIIGERFCTKFGSKLTITLGTILHIIYIAILIFCSRWNFHSLGENFVRKTNILSDPSFFLSKVTTSIYEM